ncbi:MAG: DNA replication and repair protein RecF [Bdellovibrionaceae bacterium]|nr:DNA replication and repair protein RecF [Pseudobdellovibrionaceae bacterium]
MILETLSLTDFRNFLSQKVHLRPRVNFFVGDNGQGKTNLIEAVYILSRGSSFRPSESTSFIRQGASSHQTTLVSPDGFFHSGMDSGRARLIGRFENQGMTYDVAMSFESGRKHATVNNKRASSADLAKTFPCVLFSPESLSAIKEGPEQRRLLTDELILIENPAQADVIAEFTRCLRQRNRLLRQISEHQGDRRTSDATLESLNRIYFVLATHLTFARIQALLRIQNDFADAFCMITDATIGDISVDYLISDVSALAWDERLIFDAIQKRHQQLASQEVHAGTSLVGPHKHDIKFLLGGNDSRFYCSQGQQRALILAFKIAQIVYHRRVHQTYPVLLLDDVLSELDVKKRVNLMKFLEGISAQVLITATDLTWSDQFAADSNSVYSVRDGHIERLATT